MPSNVSRQIQSSFYPHFWTQAIEKKVLRSAVYFPLLRQSTDMSPEGADFGR